MNKTGAVAALVLSGLLTATVGSAAQGDSPASTQPTKPPRNLKKVGDHWTPWIPPTAGPKDYLIQPGDTLWDLAGKWLADPHLWPQVWDQNRYIVDSHWIYPGDPLVVPGRPTVVPAEGALPTAPEEQPTAPGAEAEAVDETPSGAPIRPVPLVPVADEVDLYCSGYIDPNHAPADLRVAGRELEREHLAQGDVIYLNQGRDQGIAPGSEFGVLRETRSIFHPVSQENLGNFIKRLGRVRVLAAQETTATAVIEMACEDIVLGDELAPWAEIPIPRISSMPRFDRYDVTPRGDLRGRVVAIRDHITRAGGGNVVYTDLGTNSGVKPGDVLTLYRDNEDLPRLMLGQAIVLTVEEGTSTAKIMLSVREIGNGDGVEVIQ